MSEAPQRRKNLQEVLKDVINRRSAGESVDDQAITAKHAELMPELGERLRELRLIEEAELKALNETITVDQAATIKATITKSLGLPSDSIPGYKIVGEINRGGQGVVYRAIQQSTDRQVAIKLMRDGPFVGPRDKARFDREVHVLAQLRHPNIVAIHDSGTAAGNHYFVMDYIAGQQLDAYLAGRKCSIQETLGLFQKICEAVNAAHLRGIAHRDLKPGNIRVDENGNPSILDFGLAKIDTHEVGDSSEWRAMTMTGQFVGSLPWASPEQADGPPDRIDLRTDVYSLGVVLFQMLTGRFPYTVLGNFREVLNNILEAEPKRPSRLRQDINDEVDAIVLKCLAKEREQRYQSAAALAQDVERYLSNQPILARSPSTAYQLRKLVARHKVSFSFLVSLFVIVAGAAIWMGVLYSRADANLRRALAAEKESNIKAETATQTRDFLVGLFAVTDPSVARGNTVTAREILDKGADSIRQALEDQPEVQTTLLATLGDAYTKLGLYGKADDLLDAATKIINRRKPEMRLELATTINKHATVKHFQGNLDEAERLANEALSLLHEVFAEEHLEIATALNTLAIVNDERGNYDEAIRLYSDALAMRVKFLGSGHLDVAALSVDLAYSYQNKGDVVRAEALYRAALAIRTQQLGDDHLDVALTRHYLATLLHYYKKDFDEAELLYASALQSYRKQYGQGHPTIADLLNTYAVLLQDQKKYDQAERFLREALEIHQDKLGAEHNRVAGDINTLASILRDKGSFEEAEKLHRRALAIRRKLFGDEHRYIGITLSSLGLTLGRMKKYEDAEASLKEAHAVLGAALPEGHQTTVDAIERLADVYDAWGKPEEAAKYRALLAKETASDEVNR